MFQRTLAARLLSPRAAALLQPARRRWRDTQQQIRWHCCRAARLWKRLDMHGGTARQQKADGRLKRSGAAGASPWVPLGRGAGGCAAVG